MKKIRFFFSPKVVKTTPKSCILMAVGRFFFLCSPDCPKQRRTSFPFYNFFYTIVSPKVSDVYHLVCCRLVSDLGDFSYNIILFYFVLYIVLTFFYLRLTWWNKKKMMPTILQMSLTKHYLTTNHKIPQTVSYFHFNDGVTIIFSL